MSFVLKKHNSISKQLQKNPQLPSVITQHIYYKRGDKMLLLALSTLISINHLSTLSWDKFVFPLSKHRRTSGCRRSILPFVNHQPAIHAGLPVQFDNLSRALRQTTTSVVSVLELILPSNPNSADKNMPACEHI